MDPFMLTKKLERVINTLRIPIKDFKVNEQNKFQSLDEYHRFECPFKNDYVYVLNDIIIHKKLTFL